MEVLFAKPGDILYSYPELPDPNSIYTKEPASRRLLGDFSLLGLARYLALLETVVLHERIVAGSAVVPIDNNQDFESEAFRALGRGYRLRETSLVPPLRVYPILKEKGIFEEVLVEIPDLFPSTLVDRYVNTSTVAKQIQYYETQAIEIDSNRERCRRIARHLTSYKMGIPLFLIEFASRYSIPLRISDVEIGFLSGVMQLQRRIENGVVEHLRKRLNAGALEEIKKLEQIGHTTIFPRTPIAGQILSESQTPEDLLQVALRLRREYSAFRRETSKLEMEIFDPDLTLAERLRKLNYVNEIANELWTRKEVGRAIFQQVTDEVSAISDIGVSATNPLTFLSIPNAILSITQLPWKLVRSQLRRRKIRAMLKTKNAFLNSRSTTKHIAHMFRCREEIVRPIIIRSRKMDRRMQLGILLRNDLPSEI